MSERHLRRILAAYGREGAAALAYGNRGRQPANTTTDSTPTAVVELGRSRYVEVNHTHLTELLVEREGDRVEPLYCAAHPGEVRF